MLLSLRSAVVVAAVSLAIVSGCTCGGPADEVEVVPFPSTTVLSDADLSALSPETVPGELVFTEDSEALKGLKPGSVLAAGLSPTTPSGLLRLVRSVERGPEGVKLVTVHAPIQLAFRKVHVKASRSTGELAPALEGSAVAPLISGATTVGGGGADGKLPLDITLFDGDGDTNTTNDRVRLHGELGGAIDYTLQLDLDWGEIDELPQEVLDCVTNVLSVLSGGVQTCVLETLLPEPRTRFDVASHLSAAAGLEGAAIAEFEKEYTIFSAPLAPIPLGPLVFTPSVDAIAKVEGGASARFEVGVHASADLAMGVDLAGKGQVTLRPPELTDTDFGADTPKATLKANASIGVGARVKVPLYGVVGPHAAVRIYGEINADIDQNPCWQVLAGAETELGVRITSPELPLVGAVEVFNYTAPPLKLLDLPIADGSCEVPDEPYHLTPGSGPDAAALATPKFTPWSKLLSTPVAAEGAPAPSNDESGWTDVFRTIDGRYLVTGSGGRTLFKLDDSGALVWARNYTTDGAPLTLLRAIDTLDTSTVVLTRSPSATVGVLKMDQAGKPLFHRGLEVPFPGCTPYARSVVRDAGAGFWVAGGCVEQVGGWVAQLDANGTVQRALRFEDPSGLKVIPTTLVRVGSEVVLAGALSGGTDRMFALRIDAQGALTFGKQYVGCADLPDLSPTSGVPGQNGDVTLSGSAGAHRSGFIVRIKADGTVAFANFLGFDGGLSNVFVLNSLAELPTTGYIAAGSTVNLLGDAQTSTPGVALVGLDAVGGLLWSKRYSLARPAMPYTAAGFPGLRLSDDGGALVAAVAHDGTAEGHVWASKVFAKDGNVTFTADVATADPLSIAALPCSLSAEDWAVSAQSVQATGALLQAEATAATLAQTVLTP